MQIHLKTKPYYVVNDNDTIKSICTKLKIGEYELTNLNKLSEIECNDVLILPKPYKYCYIVKPLDTYEKIASSLNLSVEEVIRATKNKPMFIGQKILFY